jgi:amino acid permease
MIFNVVFALGELAILFPISGGFYTYSTRFIDPSWGFAMGWNYVFQWAIVVPLEITVAAITIDYWQPGVNVAVWITIFIGLSSQHSCRLQDDSVADLEYKWPSSSSMSSVYSDTAKKNSGQVF